MTRYSIEQRLIANTAGGILAIFLVVGLVGDWYITNWLSRQYDESLLAKARVLVTLTKEFEDRVELDFADEFMPEFDRPDNTEYFQLWIGETRVFERSNELGSVDLPRVPLMQSGHLFRDLQLMDGRDGRLVQIVFLPQIVDKARRTPEILARRTRMTLVVAKERQSLDALLWSVHVSMLIGFATIVALVVGYISYSVRKGLKPLNEVQNQIKLMDARDLSSRVDVNDPPHEMAGVIIQFNQLMGRVEESFSREQRFASDVAHELKTPIAELRSIAEVALKWPDGNQEASGEIMSDVLDATVQMQHIVNNLLTLARCEKGQVALQPREVDIVESLEASWRPLGEEAGDKNLLFVRQFGDKVCCFTSATEFELILKNLLSNAVSYSPAGGTITARIVESDDCATLIISNTAEVLAQEDLPRIFDRLWRKEPARSSGQHSGLGLALVKAYAELLGLALDVDLTGRGLFTIQVSGMRRVASEA